MPPAVLGCPSVTEHPWSKPCQRSGIPDTLFLTSLCGSPVATGTWKLGNTSFSCPHISDCAFPHPELCLRASLKPHTHLAVAEWNKHSQTPHILPPRSRAECRQTVTNYASHQLCEISGCRFCPKFMTSSALGSWLGLQNQA